MLSLTHPDIYNKLQEIEKELDKSLKEEKLQTYINFTKEITKAKEPYLVELLTSIRNNTPLEQKYTAHDILTILESLADKYSVEID